MGQDLNRQRPSEQLLLPTRSPGSKVPSKEAPHLGVPQITGLEVGLLGTVMQAVTGVRGSEFPPRELTRAGQGSEAAALQPDKVCKQKAGHRDLGTKWSVAVPGGRSVHDSQHP